MIKIAACLLTVAFFTACSSTQTASKRTTLREMYGTGAEPASPAEGPDAVAAGPAEPSRPPEAIAAGPLDPESDPSLVPSPLLRSSAAGGL